MNAHSNTNTLTDRNVNSERNTDARAYHPGNRSNKSGWSYVHC